MKVMIYAINGRGMGHLNRTLVLARGLREVDPDTEVDFVVGSPVFNIVREAGFRVVKVPDTHHSMGFLTGIEQRQEHLHRVFDVLIQHSKPDVFLGDFVVNEGLFKLIKDHGAKLSLVMRQQKPAVVHELQKRRCMNWVDQFLLPHSEQELPLSSLPRRWQDKCWHLGPVGRELHHRDIAPTRQRFAAPEEKLVLVAVGGGGNPDSHPTLELAKEVSARCQRSADGKRVRWVLVHGPYYPGELPASTEHFTALRYELDLLPLMAAADVVICNAGYNTLRELDLCGTPALLIPLTNTGRDDQFERATKMAALGRALVCPRNAEQLNEHLLSVLDGTTLKRQVAHFSESESRDQGQLTRKALRHLLRA